MNAHMDVQSKGKLHVSDVGQDSRYSDPFTSHVFILLCSRIY